MKQVRLFRRQIGRDRMVNAPSLDCTVKSGQGLGRELAPTWPLVMGHKNGTLTDQQYVDGYAALLEPRLIVPYVTALYEFGQPHGVARLCLGCFCRDSWLCHTHLLVAYFAEAYPSLFADDRGYTTEWDALMVKAMARVPKPQPVRKYASTHLRENSLNPFLDQY